MASRRWSWRNLIKKPLSLREVVNILGGLDEMPDRGVALVCSALVERGLEDAILARMTRLKSSRRKQIFDSPGPLSGFLPKIKIGYALAVYGDKGFKELDKIREIRNAFAHSIHNVTFSTPRIKRHCMNLDSPQQKVIPVILTLLGRMDLRDNRPPPELIAARDRYIYTTTLLWLLLKGTDTQRPHRPRGAWSEFLIP